LQGFRGRGSWEMQPLSCPALPAGSRTVSSQPVTAGRTRIPRGGVCSAVRARSEIKICTSSLRVWQVLVYVRDARIGGHFPTLSLLQRRATRWIGRFSRAATSGIGLAAKVVASACPSLCPVSAQSLPLTPASRRLVSRQGLVPASSSRNISASYQRCSCPGTEPPPCFCIAESSGRPASKSFSVLILICRVVFSAECSFAFSQAVRLHPPEQPRAWLWDKTRRAYHGNHNIRAGL